MKTLLWGVLGLSLLDLVLTSDVASNLPVVLKGVARWVTNWMDPAVPLLTQTGNIPTTATPPVTSPPPITTATVSAPPPPGTLPPSSVSVA